MKKVSEILQEKANKCANLISKALSISSDLEPKNVTINIEAIPCKLEEDGSFLVLTGTKDKPYGIGVKTPPEYALVYNEKGGALVDSSSIRDFIRENRDKIKPEIDSTYSIMGVRLNVGVISSYLGEDFLTALHLSSVHDS